MQKCSMYRGKTRYGEQRWAYGSLIQGKDYCCILEDYDGTDLYYPKLDGENGYINGYATPVITETIGEYIQLCDKHCKLIFEGDIVKTKYGRLCIVEWLSSPNYRGWDLKPINTIENCVHTKTPDSYDIYKPKNLEVVGNIHDNPELLKESKYV